MSAEGPADRPPPPPPPDPPKRQYEAAAVIDEGGGSLADIVDRHPADHQANVRSADATGAQSEPVSRPGGTPEVHEASLTRDRQLERWKQADARAYSDRLERATPEQVSELREAAQREFDHTLERMQATALKDDQESNDAWRDAFDRNQIAQQRLEMIGGMEPPDNRPPDGGGSNGGGEQPGRPEPTRIDLRPVQDFEPVHRGSSATNDMDDPNMSYIERLRIANRSDFRVDTSKPLGTTGSAAEFVGGNLERTTTLHDQATVGERSATQSVDRPTVNLDADVHDVNAFRERVRQGDRPGTDVDIYNLPNCSACAKALDARLAGDSTAQAGFLDQRALERNYDSPGQRPQREGITSENPTGQLQSEWGRDITREPWADVTQELKDGGSGTRGVLLLEKEIDGKRYAHVANVLNNAGQIEILDGQIGKRYGDWSSYTRDSRFTQDDVTGWIRTSPERPGGESTLPTSGDTPDSGVRPETSQAFIDSRVARAEQREDESRQAEVAADRTAAGAVESVRANARAEVIKAERDIDAASKEIRDIEDRAALTDERSSAGSDRLDELQRSRSDADDRLDQNLGMQRDPNSAVKGGQIEEAERARAEAEQAEREAEDARRRQQMPS